VPVKIGGAKVALVCVLIEAVGQALIWLARVSRLVARARESGAWFHRRQDRTRVGICCQHGGGAVLGDDPDATPVPPGK
jgi:hypothetical protein